MCTQFCTILYKLKIGDFISTCNWKSNYKMKSLSITRRFYVILESDKLEKYSLCSIEKGLNFCKINNTNLSG